MKAREVKQILNITQNTLSSYVKSGKIKVHKINDYNYIYNDEDVYKIIGVKNNKKEKYNVTYARVSNNTRKQDLLEQSNRIYNYATNKGLDIKYNFRDCKSGMSFDRENFNKLLEYVIKGEVNLVIIENKDRLCRFGFELLQNVFKYYGTKILVISNEEIEKTSEQELTEDLISIIHYFSMKSYSNRRKLNKIKKELESI